MVMSLIVTMGIAANNKKKAQQPLKPMNEFVSELMGKMTVQEKIGQLNLLPRVISKRVSQITAL